MPESALVPRQLASLVLLFPAVLWGSPAMAIEPWEMAPYAQTPVDSGILRSAVPGPPQRPMPVSRPVSWPGTPTSAEADAQGEAYSTDAPASASPQVSPAGFTYPQTGMPAGLGARSAGPHDTPTGARQAPADAGPAGASDLKPCEGAQPLATVGREWILAGEVLGVVNEVFAQNKEKLSRLSPGELEQQRILLIQQTLRRRIETKLVYLDAKRTIPTENMPVFEQKIGEAFEKSVVPSMIEQSKLASRPELDAKLRSYGTSLERQKRSFIEQEVAKEWLHEKVKINEDISHEEIRNYYQEHLKEYEYPAQARWEHLMVRPSDFRSKQEAWGAIAEMGNQVMSGAPFAEVARARSKGPTAGSGGKRDWTRQGSLVSHVLDEALFSLPVGQLSQILEDAQGLHIIRVTERKDAGRTPFLEVQGEIRKKIREKRREKQEDDYLERLRKEIPVRTVFDSPAESNPLAGARPDARPDSPKP